MFKSLLLTWKSKNSNLYYHIGTLSYDGTKYVFEYSHKSKSERNVAAALKQGFFLHPAFPKLKKTYVSERLFTTFDRRIPDQSRVGYDKILDEFHLPSNADRMDLLRETRGAIASDDYSFEEPLKLNNNKLTTNVYINGMRHIENLPSNWSGHLSAGDELTLNMDEGNVYDCYAVEIFTLSGQKLGFIPGIHAKAVHALLKQNIPIYAEIKETKPHMAPQWWVRIHLSAVLSAGINETLEHNEIQELIAREIA